MIFVVVITEKQNLYFNRENAENIFHQKGDKNIRVDSNVENFLIEKQNLRVFSDRVVGNEKTIKEVEEKEINGENDFLTIREAGSRIIVSVYVFQNSNKRKCFKNINMSLPKF